MTLLAPFQFRNFSRRSVLAVFVVLSCFYQLNSTSARRPNVVLIVADDLGYRELGSFGQRKIKTPDLDRLAQQGMRFTQHYSGNAVCAPSRCVLMTGKHPGHAQVRNNREMKPEGQYPLSADETTLPELLRANGYATGAFGKWGLGGPGSEGDPLHQGFQRFFGYNCQRIAHSYYPASLWNNAERFPLDNDPPVPGHAKLAQGADPNNPASYDAFKGADYAPDRINKQALEFIRQHQDEPFFLYYPTVIPHLALHVPDEELEPYLKLGWDEPPLGNIKGKRFGYTPHIAPRAAYAAMITRMDRYVGNLLRLLDELALADDTIVIFTSDNGTSMLDTEVDAKFFHSVGELRGLKGSLYEGGLRVPAIVRWNNHVAAGSTSDFVSGFEDWLPTILQLTQSQQTQLSDSDLTGVDGISLVPTLLGEAQLPRESLYREFPGYGGQQCIRRGDWKAIRTKIIKGNRQIELYYLAEDVGEQHDLAQQNPEIVARLEQRMAEQHVRSEPFPLGWIDK